MKSQLQKDLEREAIEAGRLTPEEITGKSSNESGTGSTSKSEERDQLTRVDKESIIDTPINFPNLNSDTIQDYIKSCPTDDKGRAIVPDPIFDEYYKILPNGTKNESGTKQARNGGILKPFGADPEAEKDIQRKGGEALQAQLKQRRTMAEDLIIMLSQKASPEIIAQFNLKADATNQEAVTAAAIREAMEGNIKAGQFVRDTIGEQPTSKQDLSVTMTDEDKKLLEKVEARLNS